MKKIPTPLTNSPCYTTPSLSITIFLSLTIPLMTNAAAKPVLITKDPILQHSEDKEGMAKIIVYNTSAYPIIIKAICQDSVAGFIDKYAEVLESANEPETETTNATKEHAKNAFEINTAKTSSLKDTKTTAPKEHSKLKTSQTAKADAHVKNQPTTATKNAHVQSSTKKTALSGNLPLDLSGEALGEKKIDTAKIHATKDQDLKPIAPMSTGTIYVPHHAKSLYALIQTDFPYARTDAIDFNVQKEDDAFVFTTHDGNPRLVCQETTQKKSLLFFNQTDVEQTVIFIVDYAISIFSYKAKSLAFTIAAHKALRIPAPTNSSQFSIGTVTISIAKKETPFVITQPEYSPTVVITQLESSK